MKKKLDQELSPEIWNSGPWDFWFGVCCWDPTRTTETILIMWNRGKWIQGTGYTCDGRVVKTLSRRYRGSLEISNSRKLLPSWGWWNIGQYCRAVLRGRDLQRELDPWWALLLEMDTVEEKWPLHSTYQDREGGEKYPALSLPPSRLQPGSPIG